jgi:hypothetical protein
VPDERHPNEWSCSSGWPEAGRIDASGDHGGGDVDHAVPASCRPDGAQ